MAPSRLEVHALGLHLRHQPTNTLTRTPTRFLLTLSRAQKKCFATRVSPRNRTHVRVLDITVSLARKAVERLSRDFFSSADPAVGKAAARLRGITATACLAPFFCPAAAATAAAAAADNGGGGGGGGVDDDKASVRILLLSLLFCFACDKQAFRVDVFAYCEAGCSERAPGGALSCGFIGEYICVCVCVHFPVGFAALESFACKQRARWRDKQTD